MENEMKVKGVELAYVDVAYDVHVNWGEGYKDTARRVVVRVGEEHSPRLISVEHETKLPVIEIEGLYRVFQAVKTKIGEDGIYSLLSTEK